MTVHSIHIFDRKGKTLFTKSYAKRKNNEMTEEEVTQLSEQRKLVFGMLFSLDQICTSLSPTSAPDKSLQKIKTGASTCHCFATTSGLYFCIYLTPPTAANKVPPKDAQVREVLKHIYHEIWIQTVTRSPLYRPTTPNVQGTNFMPQLDTYLRKQTWFR